MSNMRSNLYHIITFDVGTVDFLLNTMRQNLAITSVVEKICIGIYG